jgi:hypothetical protein
MANSKSNSNNSNTATAIQATATAKPRHGRTTRESVGQRSVWSSSEYNIAIQRETMAASSALASVIDVELFKKILRRWVLGSVEL